MNRWFKRVAVGLLAFFAVAGVAHAAPALQKLASAFTGGVWIVSPGIAFSDAHKITESLGTANVSIDFAGVTDQCEDSAGQTVTGAAVGDTCTLGLPSTMPGTHSWVTCRVSAANTVILRHCSHGASGNPAAADYRVRTFSNQ